MKSHKDRLDKLEAQRDAAANRVEWSDVDLALARQEARIRLKFCRALDVDSADPRRLEAQAILAGDDAAQVAHDQDVISRWRHQQGIQPDLSGVRERINEKFDEIARRRAEHEPN